MRVVRPFLAGIIALASVGVTAQQDRSAAAGPAAAAAPAADEVAISFEYTGQGDVSEKNRIWVWLFDTPEISAQSSPIDSGSLAKNGDTLKFKVIGSLAKVYVAAAYDNVGGFAGDAAPPPGTPIIVYGRNDTTPATPIERGASVKVTFDDSIKMP